MFETRSMFHDAGSQHLQRPVRGQRAGRALARPRIVAHVVLGVAAHGFGDIRLIGGILRGHAADPDEFGCAQAAALSAAMASDNATVGAPPVGRRIQRRAQCRGAMVESFDE